MSEATRSLERALSAQLGDRIQPAVIAPLASEVETLVRSAGWVYSPTQEESTTVEDQKETLVDVIEALVNTVTAALRR